MSALQKLHNFKHIKRLVSVPFRYALLVAKMCSWNISQPTASVGRSHFVWMKHFLRADCRPLRCGRHSHHSFFVNATCICMRDIAAQQFFHVNMANMLAAIGKRRWHREMNISKHLQISECSVCFILFLWYIRCVAHCTTRASCFVQSTITSASSRICCRLWRVACWPPLRYNIYFTHRTSLIP